MKLPARGSASGFAELFGDDLLQAASIDIDPW